MAVLDELVQRAGDAVLKLWQDADEARLLISSDRLVVLVNRAAEELFGRSQAELAGGPARVLTPARLAGDYDRVYETLMSGSGSVQVNLWVSTADGAEVPVRILARVVAVQGVPALLSLVILGRSQPEERSGRMRDLVESGNNANLIVDTAGRVVMADRRALQLFGFEEHELIGNPVEQLVPRNRRADHERVRRRFTGQARTHRMGMGPRVVARRKDGATFAVQVVYSSMGTGDEVLVSA